MRIPGTPRTRAALVATASAALLLTPATADARVVDDAKLVPHSHFVMQPDGSTGATAKGAQIPNIDSVKSTIRTYYGADSKGIANKESSPYITEMKAMEAAILAKMPAKAPAPNLAVVLDADDTTLWTYDMEDGAMHFNFDPKLQNDEWVMKEAFPATPGMVDFVKEVEARGFTVFGITGRGAAQEQATLNNLTKVGYTEFDADNFFTKFDSTSPKPDYLDCHTSVDPTDDPAKCTTVEYKAGTRKYIQEKLGYTIALNIGDQFSDLQGGYSLNSVKLPNPTYYLPSPNIQGAPATDASLTPRTEFTMAPNGSSGATEGGEGIPNIDSVKSTIRTYYGADPVTHKANKETSPYISELSAFASKWAPKLQSKCATGVAAGHQAGRRLRRRRHHAVDLRHGGRGDGVQLRPGAAEHLGPGGALPGHAGHGQGRPRRRRRWLQDRRPDRPQQRAAHRDARQPRQVLLRREDRQLAVPLAVLLHQVDQHRPAAGVRRLLARR